VCSASNFVMAFNWSDQTGSSGDQPDGWWCSNLFD
jgi:hypothetical protein